jgi:hypothetical protein
MRKPAPTLYRTANWSSDIAALRKRWLQKGEARLRRQLRNDAEPGRAETVNPFFQPGLAGISGFV